MREESLRKLRTPRLTLTEGLLLAMLAGCYGYFAGEAGARGEYRTISGKDRPRQMMEVFESHQPAASIGTRSL